LAGLAKRFNAIYSRYADDITFSCDINIFNFESFQNELNRIIKTENKLEIQTEKSRIQHRSFRQEVTGIIVNEKININQRYIKGIRMYLTLVERYGIEKATMLYQKDYQLDRGYQPKEKFNLKYILGGKINYLSMIRGKDDALTQKLAERWAIAFDVKKSNKTPDGEIDMNEILDLLLKSDLDKAMNKFLDHKK
jgi:retron-type reverse transcriptase